MAVKTKPRYIGIEIKVKYNPIFKTKEEKEYHWLTDKHKPW